MKNSNHRVYLVKKHPMGKNFLAICLFGFVLSARPLDAEELNNELIHAAQQKELLYIPFFIWYGIEWVALYFKYKDWMQAYAHIRFEKEAYRHQRDLNYLNRRKLEAVMASRLDKGADNLKLSVFHYKATDLKQL